MLNNHNKINCCNYYLQKNGQIPQGKSNLLIKNEEKKACSLTSPTEMHLHNVCTVDDLLYLITLNIV